MNNGYKTLDDVAKEDPVYLMSLLMDQLPWSNPFCEEDEQTEAEDESGRSRGVMSRYDKCVRLIDKLQKRGRRKQWTVCLESTLVCIQRNGIAESHSPSKLFQKAILR